MGAAGQVTAAPIASSAVQLEDAKSESNEAPQIPISSLQWKPDLAPPNVILKPGILSPVIVERFKHGTCQNIFWQEGIGSESKPFAITWSGPPYQEGPNVSGLFAMDQSVLEMTGLFISTFNVTIDERREVIVGEEMAPRVYGSLDQAPKYWTFYGKRLKTMSCVPKEEHCKIYQAHAKLIETRADLGFPGQFREADIGLIRIKARCTGGEHPREPFWRPSILMRLFEGILRHD